jgi:Fe2+ transport system protein FeoA
MTLRELSVGKSARVLAVGGEKILRRRLLDMGITPRTVMTFSNRSIITYVRRNLV